MTSERAPWVDHCNSAQSGALLHIALDDGLVNPLTRLPTERGLQPFFDKAPLYAVNLASADVQNLRNLFAAATLGAILRCIAIQQNQRRENLLHSISVSDQRFKPLSFFDIQCDDVFSHLSILDCSRTSALTNDISGVTRHWQV